MRNLDSLRASITEQRVRIPLLNRKKFDAEVKSYLAEMEVASDERFNLLCEKLWQRTMWLQSCRKAISAPPLLCRKINESREAYLDRIYAEGGYHYAR